MSDFPFLVVMIAVPAVGAAVVAALPKGRDLLARQLALGISLVVLVLAVLAAVALVASVAVAALPPMLLRSASIRSTTFSPRGRAFVLMGLPARFWLMRSMRAVSYWSSNLSGSKCPAF